MESELKSKLRGKGIDNCVYSVYNRTHYYGHFKMYSVQVLHRHTQTHTYICVSVIQVYILCDSTNSYTNISIFTFSSDTPVILSTDDCILHTLEYSTHKFIFINHCQHCSMLTVEIIRIRVRCHKYNEL